MRYEIRELGLGEVLDQAIALTRSRLRTLLGISLVLDVPYNLVLQFVTLRLTPPPPPNPNLVDQQLFLMELIKVMLYFVLPALLLQYLIIVPITSAALIHVVAGEYLEQPIGVWESLKRTVSRPLGLWATCLPLYLIVGIGLFCCGIPGVIAYLFFGLAMPAFVIQGMAGFSALDRSTKLTTGNLTSFFALLFLLAVIGWQVASVPSLIPQDHLRIVCVVGVGAVLNVFSTAAIVAFYFSCRCRTEQFDLAHLARSVRLAPVPPPQPLEA